MVCEKHLGKLTALAFLSKALTKLVDILCRDFRTGVRFSPSPPDDLMNKVNLVSWCAIGTQ